MDIEFEDACLKLLYDQELYELVKRKNEERPADLLGTDKSSSQESSLLALYDRLGVVEEKFLNYRLRFVGEGYTKRKFCYYLCQQQGGDYLITTLKDEEEAINDEEESIKILKTDFNNIARIYRSYYYALSCLNWLGDGELPYNHIKVKIFEIEDWDAYDKLKNAIGGHRYYQDCIVDVIMFNERSVQPCNMFFREPT